MEVRRVLDSLRPNTQKPKTASESKARADLTAIENIGSPEQKDSSRIDFQDLYKSLSITGKQIVDAINEKLALTLPEGVQSLKPEDVTPEATAERIVSGVIGLYDIFSRQNSKLGDSEKLEQFLKTVKGGIEKGYGEAIAILEGLGAFKFDGVKEGVEKTRVLIDEKLQAFEVQQRNAIAAKSETKPVEKKPSDTLHSEGEIQ